MIFSTVAKLHWDCIEAVKARLETALAADSASNDQSTYSLWCGRPSPQTSAKNSQQRTREFRAPLLILYKCMYVTIYILSFLARPTHALLLLSAFFLSCTTQKNRGCCYATDSSVLYSGCCCCYIDRRRVDKKKAKALLTTARGQLLTGLTACDHLFCTGVIGKG